MSEDIKKGERFQVGEVWQSPRGFLYKVTDVSGRQAIMRMGSHGKGRIRRRWVDAIEGWSIYKGEA